MVPTISIGVDRFRKPEYTGENRCIPCTIANFTIAIILSIATKRVFSMSAMTIVFVLFSIAIYFRGYLIPGTPMITKRYFPAWLLNVFSDYETRTLIEEEAIDIEKELTQAGILTKCENADDLCLHERFRTEWRARMDSIQEDYDRHKVLIDLFDIDGEKLHFDEYHDDGAFIARADENQVGQWESRAAFQADMAAAELLRTRIDKWATMSVAARSQLLGGLRLFLNACPVCGEKVTLGEDTVESCCRSIDVVAVTCTGCNSRLFEMEQSPTNT